MDCFIIFSFQSADLGSLLLLNRPPEWGYWFTRESKEVNLLAFEFLIARCRSSFRFGDVLEIFKVSMRRLRFWILGLSLSLL